MLWLDSTIRWLTMIRFNGTFNFFSHKWGMNTSFLIFFCFAFPCHCRDSGASWLRWNRPSRQPGNSWETRTDGGSRQTGQSRAPWGLWCFHVLSDVRPQGTLQQGTQRLMTQQCVRRCCQLKRIEEVIYCVTALQRRTWTLLWQSVFREQLHRRQKQPH